MKSNAEIARELETLLPRVIRSLHRDGMQDPLREIPIAQARVLILLQDGPTTPSKMSAELGMTPSAISQVIKRLRLGGWILHSEDDEDLRVRHLRLSEFGAAQMEARLSQRACSAEAKVIQLDEAEKAELIRILQKVVDLPGGERRPLVDIAEDGISEDIHVS